MTMTRGALIPVILFVASLGWASPGQAQGAAEASIDYVVQRGDTLVSFARRYMVRPQDYVELGRLNRIREPRRLVVGSVLSVPARLLRSEPARARVTNFSGPVSVEVDGRSIAAAVGTEIAQGATVVTGPNAFVRLRLEDASVVSLPSNSRVRVERLRTFVLGGASDHVFDLETGRAESRAVPVRRPGRFEIRTPVSVSAVRGTEFRSAYDPQTGRGATEVLEGTVEVSNDAATLAVGPAEGVTASADGLKIADLLPGPEMRDGDDLQIAPTVVVRLLPLPGAVRYRVRIATDAGMTDAFAEADSDPGSTSVSLDAIADGAYFIRASAISGDGLEGRATTFSILRARSGVGALGAGAVGAGRDRAYLFRWEAEGAGEASYRFQLTQEDHEVPVIDLPGLKTAELSLTGLTPGAYGWRVQSSRLVMGRRIDTWSEVSSLRIGR